MPFTGRSKKGRPRGSTSTGYKHLSAEEKSEYHAESVREHRQRLEKETKSQKSTKTPSNPPNTIEQSEASSSGKRGRKPVSGTAMTPNTRAKRKLQQQKTRRHKEKVSETRSKISRTLWNKNTHQDDEEIDTESESEP